MVLDFYLNVTTEAIKHYEDQIKDKYFYYTIFEVIFPSTDQ